MSRSLFFYLFLSIFLFIGGISFVWQEDGKKKKLQFSLIKWFDGVIHSPMMQKIQAIAIQAQLKLILWSRVLL